MPLSLLEISQDNVYNGSDLMPIHSDLTFLIDVTYSGTRPDFIYCDVFNEDTELLGTFKCIPYKDLSLSIRQFAFKSSSVLRGYMNEYDDFVQSEYSFLPVPDITKYFKLTFRDPDGVASEVSQEIYAIHGANQFGQNPNKDDIYNNETDTYITAENQPVYVYFYNDDATNTVTVEDQSFQLVTALDYDDTEFADYDDTLFTIDIIE